MKRSLAAWAVGVVPITSSAALVHARGAAIEPTAAAAPAESTSPSEPAPSEAAPSEPAPTGDAAPARTDGKASGSVTVGAAPRGHARGARRKPAADTDAMQGNSREAKRLRYKQLPWIRRWAPQRNTGELGVFGGAFIPSEQHDLYDPITRPPEPFWRVGPDVGVRAAFFPLRALGAEVEFNAMPTRLRNLTNDFAFVYGFQAHAVIQLPFYSVVPFFLAGGGLLGVRSHLLVLGKDVDPAFHYGGGVKVNFSPVVGARIDVRNIVSSTEALQNSGAANVQVLAGLSFTLGRKPPPPPPKKPPPEDPDRDKDGILNKLDECPDTAGVAPHGCPDSDGDGFRDKVDACPEVPGVAPDGCPVKDTDGDGFLDPDDDCVFEPETKNGFEDGDGCPDDLPPPVKEFHGNIQGIEFDFRKDTIRKISRPVLDKAVAVLKEFPEVKVNIIGHTDNVGLPEFNLDLSRRRAEAVKKYMVDAGIDPSRITTEGRGANDPDFPNDTEENRAKNRRIEFEVTSVDSSGTAPSTSPARTPGDGGTPPASEPPAAAAPATKPQR
ncbi:MAG: OmpA family protein [Nannocystaceae bacterium]|nr:OmpA family protein [Nannocystaceae bacterium]